VPKSQIKIFNGQTPSKNAKFDLFGFAQDENVNHDRHLVENENNNNNTTPTCKAP